MIAAALETVRVDAASRRRQQRRRLRLNVAAVSTGEAAIEKVLIHDISPSGLLLEAGAVLADGEALTVDLPEAAGTIAHVVWSSGHFYGCRFDSPISAAAVSASLLQSPFDRPAEVPQAEADVPAAVADWRELDRSIERGWLPTALRIQIVAIVSVLLWALILGAIGLF